MVTSYVPRRPPREKIPKNILLVLKKDIPITEQIKDVAEALRKWCPEIFKKEEPFPIVRMVKFKKGEIVYEVTVGTSRAKTGPV